jgi:hypothetical protein
VEQRLLSSLLDAVLIHMSCISKQSGRNHISDIIAEY